MQAQCVFRFATAAGRGANLERVQPGGFEPPIPGSVFSHLPGPARRTQRHDSLQEIALRGGAPDIAPDIHHQVYPERNETLHTGAIAGFEPACHALARSTGLSIELSMGWWSRRERHAIDGQIGFSDRFLYVSGCILVCISCIHRIVGASKKPPTVLRGRLIAQTHGFVRWSLRPVQRPGDRENHRSCCSSERLSRVRFPRISSNSRRIPRRCDSATHYVHSYCA